MPRKPLALAAAILFAALVPSARAAIVPGQVIDGPSANILRFGDIDLAPDGTGALVYVKTVGGNNNIFVSVFNGTSWGPGQELSNGTLCPAQFSCSDPHVAAGNGGRVVVTFVANAAAGAGNLEAALKPNAAGTFQLADAAPGSDGEIQGDDVDMDPASGVAYAVMDQIANVRASRLSGSTWTEVLGAGNLGNISGSNNDTPLNLASGNQNTARVAVDSAGNGVVAWPGQDSGGKGQVFARRLVGTTAPQPSVTMSIPSLAGKPADGNNVNMITMDGGGSANPWIAFREQFTYGAQGRVRDLAAQLVGNSASPAQPLDGLPLDTPTEGAEFPRVDVNPAGQGLAGVSRQLTFQAFGSSLVGGIWSTGFRLDSGTPTSQSFEGAAIADSGNGLFAGADTSTAPSKVVSRQDVGGALGAPVTLSRSGDGPILPTTDFEVGLSSSAAGTVAVGFGQGNGSTTNEIVAAVVDLPQPGGGGGGGTNPPVAKPAISSLKLSRTTFARGTKLATITRKHPVGTTISFSVSAQSSTTFSFARKTKGFKAGKRCVARRPKGLKGKPKRCTRFVSAGNLRFSTSAGTHKVHFEGVLSRRKKLRPGRYRLTVVSSNSAGKSAPKRASFTLLKK
jgi:hypothetical protein